MSRGVSTSYHFGTAEGFLKKGTGNGVILHMKNETGRGFTADALSKYSPEREVILSGTITVDKFKLTLYCDVAGVNKLVRVECTEEMIMMRLGLRLIYVRKNVNFTDEIKPMLDSLLSGQEFEINEKGATYKLKMMDKSALLKVDSTIS